MSQQSQTTPSEGKPSRRHRFKPGNPYGKRFQPTHGDTDSKLHRAWRRIRQRCGNPNFKQWNDYGGRGITVCDEWQAYVPFRDWALANGWREGLTIERKDNDGNYEPDNCCWIPLKDQAKNRRSKWRNR